MNQEQFNLRWGEKMTALEKELGIQPGGLKDFVAAQKAAQKPKPPAGETLTGPELRMAKMEALMLQGISGKQIPVILENFNIKGKTREEIDASIQQLISVGLLKMETPAQQGNQQQPQPPTAAQGAGNPGVSTPPGKKIWKTSEIAKMSPAEHIKNKDEILLAMSDGRIIEG